MTPIVKTCNTNNCEIVITDLTQDSDEYISEDTPQEDLEAYYSINKFKYTETYTVNIFQKNTSEESMEIIDTIITCHGNDLDEVHYNLTPDGYYVIYHLIIPSLDWYLEESSKEESIIKSDMGIYVTDGSKIYKQTDGVLTEVNSYLIAQVNTEDTTLSRITLEEFSICHLFDCYLSLCKQIFNNISYRCLSKDNIEDLIFKRDFIWMTINVLKYYVETNQFFEAQRLLTEINYCGGICNEPTMQKKSGCGCSR